MRQVDPTVGQAVPYGPATAESLAPRLRLIAHLRGLIDHIGSAMAPDDVLLATTDLVQRAASLLECLPHRDGYTRELDGVLSGYGPHGERGPFTGALHVFAPDFVVEVNGEGLDRTVSCSAAYGAAYEGAPGLLQGGFIIAAFDEILAFAQAGAGRMTADLQVAYRAPAPLHKLLRYSARLVRIDGRKAFVEGSLHSGDTLCAFAKGLFIAPRPKIPAFENTR